MHTSTELCHRRVGPVSDGGGSFRRRVGGGPWFRGSGKVPFLPPPSRRAGPLIAPWAQVSRCASSVPPRSRLVPGSHRRRWWRSSPPADLPWLWDPPGYEEPPEAGPGPSSTLGPVVGWRIAGSTPPRSRPRSRCSGPPPPPPTTGRLLRRPSPPRRSGPPPLTVILPSRPRTASMLSARPAEPLIGRSQRHCVV